MGECIWGAQPASASDFPDGDFQVFKSYTPEGGDEGYNYAVDIPGISSDTDLYDGLTLCICPHTSCTDGASLKIGSCEAWIQAKNVSGELSYGVLSSAALKQGHFYLLKFSYMAWAWIIADSYYITPEDIAGQIPVCGGGHGRISIPEGCYLVGSNSDTMMEVKAPDEVREHIGAASIEYVDGLVGSLNSILDSINGEVI